MSENTRMQVFAVKDKDDFYYIGYNQWDKQIRKAKLYVSYKQAERMADDERFFERECYLVRVDIVEVCKLDYSM